jgi:hypothetical protein
VSASTATLVKRRTGIDITGKELRLDHSGIIHAWNGHGPGGKVQGAKPISRGDLIRGVTSLNKATSISTGTARGRSGLRFEATFTNRRGTMKVIYETSSKAVYAMNMFWVR